MSELAELPNEDGRRARRDRNKYAVVDAYLALVRQGNPRPSVADVAAHSGVSHRSVFRYFSDKDELARTAIERQHDAARPLVALTVGAGAPLDERLGKFVARRLDLYEVIAPVARLSRSLVSVQPVLSAELALTRQFLRHQIKHLFAAELDAMEPDDATQTVAALDVLCSFEGVDLMGIDQRLDRPAIEATLRRAMARLLTA